MEQEPLYVPLRPLSYKKKDSDDTAPETLPETEQQTEQQSDQVSEEQKPGEHKIEQDKLAHEAGLAIRIAQINEQKGSYRNATESQLLEEIEAARLRKRNGKGKDKAAGDTDSADNAQDAIAVATSADRVSKGRREMLEFAQYVHHITSHHITTQLEPVANSVVPYPIGKLVTRLQSLSILSLCYSPNSRRPRPPARSPQPLQTKLNRLYLREQLMLTTLPSNQRMRLPARTPRTSLSSHRAGSLQVLRLPRRNFALQLPESIKKFRLRTLIGKTYYVSKRRDGKSCEIQPIGKCWPYSVQVWKLVGHTRTGA